MTRNEINKYTTLKVILKQKRDEYEESVYDLETEIARLKESND